MSEVAARMERIEAEIISEAYGAGAELPSGPLHDLMQTLGVPGVSIAVIAGGYIEWSNGYGVREAGNPDPVTGDTMFQAASISKPVAVMGALRLVQDGILDLDEDANTYLRSWKVPANDGWQPRVTLRHLMCHGAGAAVHGFPGYSRSSAIPTVPQVLDGAAPANTPAVRINAVPGTQFRYSGGGLTILQHIMTEVTGERFHDLMHDLVLKPLGMAHSTYEQPLPERLWDTAASGHRTAGVPVGGKWHVYPEMAAAGLWTTPSDLARVAIEVQRAWSGSESTLLSGETVREMLHPQVEPLIGLGFFLDGAGSASRFGHSGGNEGFRCELTAYRESGRAAVVMTNSDSGWELARAILLTIAREYGWPEYPPVQRAVRRPAPEAQADYVGEYELKPDFRFTVAQEDGRLFLQPTGQEPMTLYPYSDTEYFARAVEAEVAFTQTEDGQVNGLQLRQNDREISARRVPSTLPRS